MQSLPRTILRGLIVIAVLIAVGFVLKRWGIGGGILNEAWIDANIRENGTAGGLLFLAIGGAFTAVGFPRQAVSFLAGFAFGLLAGTLLALAATTIGCVLSFSFSRFLARRWIAVRFGVRIAAATSSPTLSLASLGPPPLLSSEVRPSAISRRPLSSRFWAAELASNRGSASASASCCSFCRRRSASICSAATARALGR